MRKNKLKTKSPPPLSAKALPSHTSKNNERPQEPLKELGFILTPEDERVLKEFCDSVPEIEEISLESWAGSQARLDLIIPCFISAVEAKAGLNKQIFFSRTIWDPKSPKTVLSKIKTTCEIVVEPGILAGTKIVKEGLGDSLGERAGDLIVTICFK